jgi:branched-chain amino acid transport system permease protein
MKRLFSYKPIIYVLLGIIVILIPLIFDLGRSTLTMWNLVIIYSIAALGFNILLGYAGQISLGHAAFMGLGAYVSAYFTMKLELSFLTSLALAGIIPLLIGLLLGLVALRLAGHYLAIATLGLGVAIQQVFMEWTEFTNGFSGMRVGYPVIFGFEFREREHFLILSVIIFLIIVFFTYNVLHSKTGRALIAMRDSSHAAQAMGVSLFKYKLIAFGFSAFYAGIAGSLFAHLIRFTEPLQWGINTSLNLLAMVVIGGLASIPGSILGAAFIVIIPELIREISFLEKITSISSILTGVALIVVIMFFPHGLARIGIQLKSSLINRKNQGNKEG